MLTFQECLTFSLVATASAAFFYSFVALVAVSPRLRQKAGKLLSLPNPSTNQQFAALDTYRGVAASMVALAHVWVFCQPLFNATQQSLWPPLAVAGNKAVPLFVTLSGYLIFRSVKRIDTIESLQRYVKRRFLRIYPVYLVTCVLGYVVRQAKFDFSNFLSQVFMVRVIDQAHLFFINPPAWSLYVEVLFYLVLPFWFFCLRNKALWAAIISFCILVVVDPLASRELWLWKYFFSGIIVSEVCDRVSGIMGEKMAISLALIGFVLLCLDFSVSPTGRFDWFNMLGLVHKNLAEYTVGLAVGFGLLLVGTLNSKFVSAVIGFAPFRIVGNVSYSMYLLHPFFILAVFPRLRFAAVPKIQPLVDYPVLFPFWYVPLVVFPGILLFPMLCFVAVERPFLKLRPK